MRILMINQAFYPDVVATAQHGHDLAKYLVQNGHEVSVVSSRVLYGDRKVSLSRREIVDGIQINRVGRAFFGKASNKLRLLDYIYFLIRATIRAVTLPRHDVVICFTTPPFVVLIGRIVRFFKRSKFIYWVMDLYPDVLVACGVAKEDKLAIRLLDRLNTSSIRKSDATVVLGRCMLQRIQSKCVPTQNLKVIGVWSDQEEVKSVERDANPYRTEWGVGDRMLVMYSGNFGIGHDVETFLEAAKALKDDDRIRFAFVGGGKRRGRVEDFVREEGLEETCILAPYQPRERLDELLSAADAHLVTLRTGAEGVMVPSKYFGILASGRPALYIGQPTSEIARITQEENCGTAVLEGDIDGLVRAIQAYAENPQEREAAGERGRTALIEKFSMECRCRQWLQVIEGLGEAPPSKAVHEVSVNAGASDGANTATSDEQSDGRIMNALSFDIEDWFHMVEIDAVSNPNDWPSFDTVAERRTDEILQTCSDSGVRATFYILGWIADRYPGLVNRIADAGHEIGTHSYWHRTVYSLDPKTFHEDLHRSIGAIQDAAGCEITSFRAPSFSIMPGCEWAFDVMHDLGLRYDSSLSPAPRGHGGYPCPREPHVFMGAPSGRGMPEFPLSSMKIGPKRLIFSGGGYMRLMPSWLIHRGFKQVNGQGLPVLVYLHPHDFAPEKPRVPMSKSRHFKSYVGLDTTNRKLMALLNEFRFGTCEEVLAKSLGERMGDSTCST